MKTKRFLSMLLALCLAVGMAFAAGISVQAATEITVTIAVQFQDNTGFDVYPRSFNVAANLSETYSISDDFAGAKVSYVDALVAVTLAMFPGDNPNSHLVVGGGGFITNFWSNTSGDLMFLANGSFTDAATAEEINDGDRVEVFCYPYGYLYTYGMDYYTWFEKGGSRVDKLELLVGESVNLTLMGYSAMDVMWSDPMPNLAQLIASGDVGPVDDATVAILLDRADGFGGDVKTPFSKLTGEAGGAGNITVSFATPGVYHIMATGDDCGDYAAPVIGGLLEITVVDLAALKAEKIAAINAVTSGLNAASYTEASWNALQTAMTSAIAAVNAATTNAGVKAVAVPNKTSILVAKSSGGGGSETDPLPAAKSTQTAAINAVTDGLKEEDYTAESWAALQAALAKALADVNAATTVAGVNAVALPSKDSLVPTELGAARTEKIAEISALLDGLDEEDYTAESWSALQDAIAQAIAAVNAAATVEAVNAVALPTKSDLAVTEATLAAARTARIAAINAVTDGLNAADYTAESWAALQAAITKAIAEVGAAETLAEIEAVAVPTASGLVAQTELTLLEKWEAKLPQWLSGISALPDWLEWVLMIGVFGWIWWFV